MRDGAKIVLLMFLLILGCSTEPDPSDSIELGIVSLSIPGNPDITYDLIRTELESWKLKFESDSIYLVIYSPDKDTSAAVLKEKASISLYDMYLSTSANERDDYLIQNITTDGFNGRFVSRKYSDSTYYIELYYKNVCSNNCHVLIHGSNVGVRTYKMMKKLNKNLSFKCSEN
jgi:hypothetical protein